MKIFFSFLFIVTTFILLVSCSNHEGGGVAPINPNGDSELALLMRDMFDDAMRMKLEVVKGDMPDVKNDFAEIHTADATEPEKAASEAYKIFSDNYLESVQALKEAHIDEVPTSFNSMVQNCMNCHQAMCPGPMVRIEKLYLEK